jgi:hypothetical protein
MIDDPPEALVQSPSGDGPVALPWWLRLADVVTVAGVVILASNLLFDGVRLRLGAFRLSVSTPFRTLIVVLCVAGIRHAIVRHPTLPARLAETFRRAWASDVGPVVWPAFVWSRAMVLAVGFLAVVLVGYAPNAPPYRISKNELVNLPLRWDAGWYLQIALDGYADVDRSRPQGQQNIAFFPAYPMTVRIVAALFGLRSVASLEEVRGNRAEWQYHQHRLIALAGIMVSLGSFAWALVYLFRLAREMLDVDAARGSVAIACAYPYALFFSAMYTESLFLLVTVAAFYHLRRGEHLAAGLWGLLAGLTRPNGCLLSVPLGLLALQQGFAARRQAGTPAGPALVRALTAAAMPGIGMLLYSAYLYEQTGRPLAWMDAHRAWGRVATDVEALNADRMSFIADQGIYTYSVSQPVELLNAVPALLALLLVVPVVKRLGLACGLLIVVMLVPPLLRGGFLSLGRVTATLFPLFLLGGALLRGSTRSSIVLAMAGLQAFLAVLFFTWRPFY